MSATDILFSVAKGRPGHILVSDRMRRQYEREMRDNMRFSDGPFRYAYVGPDGWTMPRLLVNGLPLRVVKGIRKPVGVTS